MGEECGHGEREECGHGGREHDQTGVAPTFSISSRVKTSGSGTYTTRSILPGLSRA